MQPWDNSKLKVTHTFDSQSHSPKFPTIYFSVCLHLITFRSSMQNVSNVVKNVFN